MAGRFLAWALLGCVGVLLPCPLRADAIPQSGLVLWLDAGDIDGDGAEDNNPAAGAPIGDRTVGTEWVDKSGRDNRVAQDEPASRPTLAGNALGGRPAVRFDGNDDCAAHRFWGSPPATKNSRCLS